MAYIADNVTQIIGRTPLVRLNRLAKGIKAEVIVKLESQNPLSSIKDRIGLSMIEDAEWRGLLTKTSVIVEPTSGNTGIALAYIAASKGYKLILTMPDTMSTERRKLLEMFGAQVILTPGDMGMPGAIQRANEIVQSNSKYVMLQQFNNPANPKTHLHTTAEEIWHDTGGRVDIIVAGVGTGGTITGVAELIKKRKKSFQVIAVEPRESSVLSGGEPGIHEIQGIGAGFIPNVLRKELIDEVVIVTKKDAGHTVRKLAQLEGILGGIASGANVWAALQVAKRPENKDKMVLTFITDSGERYISTWLFS